MALERDGSLATLCQQEEAVIHPMPDDLPHRLTAWAVRLRKWYHGDHTAALLEEAAARILELEKERRDG